MSILGKDLEDFNFILQKHKFRIDSSDDVAFSLLMDNVCGIKFKSDGDLDVTIDKTFTEVVGRNIVAFSDVPAKMVRAVNGDIVLDAKNGDIVLKGLNIRIEAVDGLGGEVTINSSNIVQIGSPIVNMQSDKLTATGAVSTSIAGGSNQSLGEFSNEASTGTDFIQSSFFGKILSAIKTFKEFFKSICN